MYRIFQDSLAVFPDVDLEGVGFKRVSLLKSLCCEEPVALECIHRRNKGFVFEGNKVLHGNACFDYQEGKSHFLLQKVNDMKSQRVRL